MATNYVQPGDTIPLTAPYIRTSGQGMLVGTIFAIALSDVASGAETEAATVGVWDITKASGALTQGAKVYWDNTNRNVTATSSGNTLIGAVTQAAASGDATARVRLNGTVV